ncbi:MAG: PilZ domain-containing protein [Candidatus Omnitrophica bacterium]|nr:PilZ domain-containing protein [Candidatus Omnitrophota bacterium]
MVESFTNRRKYVRIYRNFILLYRLKGQDSITHEMSQVNNISRGGINFSSTVTLANGSELNIELKTPFLNEKVDLEGVILECREKIVNLIYEVRVEFKNVSDQAGDVLAKIEQYAKQQGI